MSEPRRLPDPPRAPQRLSPLTPLVRAPIVALAVLGTSWQQLIDGRGLGTTGLVVLGVLVLGGVYGAASWLRTTYWIAGDELRIDTGVIGRQSRRIRIDRLQGIDIVQPLVARFFSLAELRFDVAAGSDREGRLAFLPRWEAERLRVLLLDRRDQLRDAPTGGPDGTGVDGVSLGGDPAAPGAVSLAPPPVERVLSRLDLGRLLGSLVLSTEALLLALAAAGFIASALLTGSIGLAGGVVPTLVGFGLALGRRLSGYYGFTLSESGAGLQVRRGLTALSSQTVAVHRIQGLVVTEPLLWRPFGWARLDVSIAGNVRGDAGEAQASSTLMPVAGRTEVLALARHVLAGLDPTVVPVAPPPRRARWLAPLTAWTSAVGQDAALLVSRRGFWVRRLDVVPQHKVQSVRLTQGPVQRRFRLATVHVDSPPGPVRLIAEERDVLEARRLLDQAVAHGRRRTVARL